MKRLAAALLLLSSCFALPACARNERLVDVQVQDQDTGYTLPRLPYSGRDYIEGRPGHRFAVTLQNLTGERVLAVVSVDGVNAISGQTAGASQAGYVLDPWQRIEVQGWRKSYSDIAEFYFTDLPDSYAARTGRPVNVGVIGVAAFRERRYSPPPYQPMPQIGRADSPYAESRAQSAPAPAADAAKSAAGASSSRGYEPRRERELAAQELGTGHGERRYDPVTQTVFERAGSRPNQVTSLFYDSYEALVAKGVLPTRAYDYPQQPQAFPIGFAPDPQY